jgi:hypothetical protein
VKVAICGTVASARASRTTADPRRSWNVSPLIPAASQALPHDVLNPSDVHGFPRMLVRTIGLRRSVRSRRTRSGSPAGMMIRRPVFDCLNLMWLPSNADQGSRRRSPCRCPVHSATVNASAISLPAEFRKAATSSSRQILSVRLAVYRRPPPSHGLVLMRPRSLLNDRIRANVVQA